MLGKSGRGFTLIEMLIVIAVISILAGIVLIGITGFQSTARDTRRSGDLRSAQNNLELFFTRCGHYPQLATGCGTGAASNGTLDWDTLASSLAGADVIGNEARFVSDPQDPARVYAYEYGDDGFSYVLRAEFENQSSALDESYEIDGTPIATLDCNDPFYCVGSE